MYEVYERLLKEKGVRTADVCKTTGLRQSMFSDWKSGKYQPKTDKLQLIADYFGVPLETFTSKAKPRKTVVVKIPHIPFDNSKHIERIQEIIKNEAVTLALEILNKEFPKRLDEAIDGMLTDLEWDLLGSYHEADPGTKASVRKLLDISEDDYDEEGNSISEEESEEQPIAAHAHDGATPEELEEDLRIAESDD